MNSIIKTVCAAAALAVVGAGCKKQAGPAGPPQMPPPAVVVSEAIAKDVPLYLDEIGKATAMESVTITPRTAGQIVERHFEDGADLKKGQVLFVLDKAPAEAALATAKAAVAQAQASLDFAKIELDRYSAVAGTRAISKTDYDTKANAVEVSQAQLDAAKAQVQSYQITLDFCTIRSPIDGRAGSRMVDVGNVVKENDTALLSVQKFNPIYAEFTVNEQELARVQANMAQGTLHAFVKVPADKGNGREGTLTFLDNSVQDASGTVRVRATIPNEDLHFWPGQFVQVRLVLQTLKDAVLVPTSAQQLSQKGPYVFVVGADSVAQIRPIVAGQMQGDMVVINSGLKPGEKVITDGQMMVRPNAPVSPKPDSAAPPGADSQGGLGQAPQSPQPTPGADATNEKAATTNPASANGSTP